jgi:hypothetical protein
MRSEPKKELPKYGDDEAGAGTKTGCNGSDPKPPKSSETRDPQSSHIVAAGSSSRDARPDLEGKQSTQGKNDWDTGMHAQRRGF